METIESSVQEIKATISPGKMDHVVGTGNIGAPETAFLRSLCSDVSCVRGEFDSEELPGTLVRKFGEWSFGIIHGHQVVPRGDSASLAALQRKLNADVSARVSTSQVQWQTSSPVSVSKDLLAPPQILVYGSEGFTLKNEGETRLLCPGSACNGLDAAGLPNRPRCALVRAVSPVWVRVEALPQPVRMTPYRCLPAASPLSPDVLTWCNRGDTLRCGRGTNDARSFVVLNLEGDKCEVYHYQLQGTESKTFKHTKHVLSKAS